MFEIQERFVIQSHYTAEEVAEKFAALAAEEEKDMFGIKNYYIHALDKTSRDDCPILCNVYPHEEGCQLNFIIGDKDFWAKKIHFTPAEPEKFVVKLIFGLAFWAMFVGSKPIIFMLGIFVALAVYMMNHVYPRDTYNRYKKICETQKQAMKNLFQSTKLIDAKVKSLIDEIGT